MTDAETIELILDFRRRYSNYKQETWETISRFLYNPPKGCANVKVWEEAIHTIRELFR